MSSKPAFMAKRLILILISTLLFNGCQEEGLEPPFESRIIGNWLVVTDTENYEPSVTEWGFFYVGSVKLYADKSFKVNVGELADDPNVPKHGTWELVNNNSILNRYSIRFYTYIDDFGTIYQNTTAFNLIVNSKEQLILEDNFQTIVHKKLNN